MKIKFIAGPKCGDYSLKDLGSFVRVPPNFKDERTLFHLYEKVQAISGEFYYVHAGLFEAK